MGEHKENTDALMAATIPPLLPIGHAVATQLQIQVIPSRGVVLLPAERIRTTDDGQVEIYVSSTSPGAQGDAEAGTLSWQFPPAGVSVHEFGKQLPPERCDVAIFLGTVAQDTLDKGIVGPSGRAAAPALSTALHTIIMRMPLVEWQVQHLGNLRGVQS
jgi:hypothetical protein